MLGRGAATRVWCCQVDSVHNMSESNRKAKYYKLTRTGRAQLKREVGSWERMVSAIGMVLNANGSKVTQ